MEIIAHGKDIYDKINYCNMCGCVFRTDREDGIVSLENDITKLYVQCPSCWNYILIGIAKQSFYQVKKKGENND